ncbi:MAG: nuclear transport factor 2 family protein [Sedimentisphaerales bacterium]
MADSNNDLKNEIRQAVKDINEASRKGDIEALKHFCHKDVVIVPPGFVQRAEGRDTYLKSVEDFCAKGTFLEYKELSMKIDVFGDVAVVYYSYETKWKMEDKTFNETGNDVMVLNRTEGKWLLIWRTLIPLAQVS